jgi:hypothetical protein
MVIELRLDRSLRRWITRTLAGPNQGAEIWTHAFAVEPRRTDIVVDFFVPDVAPEAREKVGQGFTNLYEQLYDEDVAMMTERQRQLDRRIDSRPPADGLLALYANWAASWSLLPLPVPISWVRSMRRASIVVLSGARGMGTSLMSLAARVFPGRRAGCRRRRRWWWMMRVRFSYGHHCRSRMSAA